MTKVWKIKNGKQSIAPLQPSILAAFRPWGGSTGAGRKSLAAANIFYFKYYEKYFYKIILFSNILFRYLCKFLINLYEQS